jgi:DNA-binding transcriptional MerR regulator
MSVKEQPPAESIEHQDPLLSIGVFARRSWLSMKALRLYDRLGLLTPAHVDAETGYRRYRESQLATARLVAMLRRLDMPLTHVADVVSASGPRAAELLASYWELVERRVASQRELATHLRIRLLGEEGSYEMFEVQEREVPEQLVLTEQRHVNAGELPEFIGAAGQRLMRAADEHRGIAGPMFVVYHGEVNEDSDGPVEVCLPIGETEGETPEAATRREPGHREAYVRLVKAQVAYPQILSAFDAVAGWVGSHGMSVTAAPRGVYFADWDAAGPGDEVCDVAFPVS